MLKRQSISLRKDVYDILQAALINEQAVTLLGKDVCDARFEELLQTLTTPPAFTTLRINLLKAEAAEIIDRLQQVLNQQYGSVEEAPKVQVHPQMSDVLVVPNSGPHNCDRQVSGEVIVDHACGMSVLRGADVFVQGIMGAPAGLAAGQLVSVYADLDGSCLKGLTKPYTGDKVFVGYGEMQFSREEIFCSKDKLSGVGVKMTYPVYRAPSIDGVLPGLIFSQNLPSLVCSRVLDPMPGETILDMCAAPGGKTGHIASLMKNKGRVVALDKTLQKVEKIARHTSQWGLTCVEAYQCDSTKIVQEGTDISGAPPYPPEMFDRVLLDGPCSALGQRPSFRNSMTLKNLQSYPVYQKKFFHSAVSLLKPGGTLVYSTCTITLEENEQQVDWALKTFPCLLLVHQIPCLGQGGYPGSGLSDEDALKCQRFDPSSVITDSDQRVDNDTIGFFIAKFTKSENPCS